MKLRSSPQVAFARQPYPGILMGDASVIAAGSLATEPPGGIVHGADLAAARLGTIVSAGAAGMS
jgi:hypothetical protein